MQKKDWKAEFKKLTYSNGSDALKMEITPYRDWRILTILSFVGLVLAGGYNVYVIIQINRDSYYVAQPKSTGVANFNEEGLAKVITSIDEKATNFENAITETRTAVDPSL
ncbi:MAG: hypothetical protein COV32_01910 [Candidatus Yonathbacteria bacterium CG10_big_fil_rev_8_21_14_0_10_43_136]|uniref:Uncharacterized protein n=2 Tax=Parcubacteria group TaxID=1794811 RepID=A0A2M7Q622_9BACT|nr:MAG: hypothetical protein AUK15_02005 [Candidatus Nomurabacteria bacterium CG2_30_43_9]PIQ35589.1 MAG: hypothetical protein COW60_03115 [Candidatus Yonathbacteria bacterium CG17_big_fil_post_rev_8_21_14_2_50_43_9]PIR40710.1 MAG: hypothetical protein COV32_01910 [Candidatus Yonathbacteria bacterium CG10_big_fil_rev_8_21_14_0_10_43_136]PIX57558.1 MAG: hypothetical protein COZ48_00005 [Candidatus Yonathbacteria bacterium CG_4_10_14_3_um_filter_43_12]PIY58525.1 MAG: hypothetical protein COY98_01